MGILDKIQEIEREIARTQKNKGSFVYDLKFLTNDVLLDIFNIIS